MKLFGKKRTKEILTILGLIAAVAAYNFRVDVTIEKDKVKNISILIGEFAKLRAENKCDFQNGDK